MQATAIKRKVSFQQVLADLSELSNSQLARLMPAVLVLRTGRGRHVLSEREAELLEEINRPLPAKTQAEFDEIVARHRKETLTARERKNLDRLIELTELHDARRLNCLVELAGLRHTTVEALMNDLGLKTPGYA
jgi:hypothetical protein